MSKLDDMLDEMRAEDIAAYVRRRNKAHPEYNATLRLVCSRFRLTQAEAMRIIEKSPLLCLSSFAYLPASYDGGFAKAMLAAWFPSYAPDAPVALRLVMVLEEGGPL